MKELNVALVDLYKEVDGFIRDAYSSEEGVREYLRLMKASEAEGRRLVNGWEPDYKELDHIRWIRNRLSHDVPYDSDITEGSDYDWLEAFRDRLYSSNDPLATLKRAEDKENQRRRSTGQNNARKTVYYPYVPVRIEVPEQKTFWQKVKEFFTGK